MKALGVALVLLPALALASAPLAGQEPGPGPAAAARPPFPHRLLKDPGDFRYDGGIFLLPLEPGNLGPDCRVHLMPEARPEEEGEYACLEWLAPPAPDLLRGWFEASDAMSYQPARFSAGPGHLMRPPVALPRPAGRVVGPGGPRAGVALRLLGGEVEPLVGRYPLDVFRSVTGERWRRGALMPEGTAIGWLWDLAEEKVLALSRPFAVVSGDDAVPPFAAPGSGAQLMAILGRDLEAARAEEETRVLLRDPRGRKLEPDYLIPTYFRVYAFWYDLPPDLYAVEAESPGSLLPRQETRLEAGTIGRVVAQLLRRPTLELELELPAELAGDAPRVSLRRSDDGEEVARRKWGAGQRRDVIGDLPAALLELRIATRSGIYFERLDLRPARDLKLALAPRRVAIQAKVGAQGDAPEAKTTWRLFRGAYFGAGLWVGDPVAPAAASATGEGTGKQPPSGLPAGHSP